MVLLSSNTYKIIKKLFENLLLLYKQVIIISTQFNSTQSNSINSNQSSTPRMLSPEELHFIRDSASIARSNVDAGQIAIAKKKLQSIYAALPPDLQHPCKDFMAMQNLEELTDFRALTILLGNPPGIPRRISVALCSNWPVSVSLIPPPLIIEAPLPIDSVRADALLQKQLDKCPSFLSF